MRSPASVPRWGSLWLVVLLLALAPQPARAQEFPPLAGRVTDAADIIPDDVEARITARLEALETQSRRQLVVATIPDLQGYEISDYGYRLGRHWGIGDKERNDGALLIVAPAERKLRIEVGYGLEPVLTDGLSSLIVNQTIVPRFKAGDMPGGIEAGVEAIAAQLTLPEEEAQRIAREAAQAQQSMNGGDIIAFTFFGFIVFLVFVAPMLRTVLAYRRKRYGPGGLASIILWTVVDTIASAKTSSGGGSSSGSFSSGGSSGGGFSGGGGSFGGGGSSGSW